MNVVMLFLPAILGLGVITSYEDIKFGKIRNKWIVGALIYYVIAYVIFFSNDLSKGINSRYGYELITNLFFSLLVAFGMWYFKIWTAGDGKLFIAFSALVPLSFYKNNYQNWFPSFILLMNVFILGLFFMLIMVIYKSKLVDLKIVIISFFKKFFTPKRLLNSIINLFAIYWVVEIVLRLIGFEDSYLFKMILTILIMGGVVRKIGDKAIYFMLLVSLIRFFLDKSIYSLQFLINFVLLIMVWRLMRSFIKGGISDLGRKIFSEEVDADLLKPGMLSNDTIQRERNMSEKNLKLLRAQKNTCVIEKKGVFFIKKQKTSFDSGNFIDEEAEGLTEEQISKIRKIGFRKLQIAQTIPFAPIMFLGVLLTLILKGNILILMQILF